IERTQLPNTLIEFVTDANLGPTMVVIILMVAYLLLGCFMDGLSVIFVTIPIVYPLIAALGIDPIWFGILVVCATEIGLITPPIGMNLFVIKGLAKDIPIQTVWKGAFPFVVADLFRLAVLIAFPILTLYLPASVR
ncbi:MAG: TRAP transporter large permease subunit, partial [Litoreibacter sp.]